MTDHLRDDEFMDAVEHTLPAARAAHVEACDACRARVAEAVDMMAVLAADAPGDVPDPGTIFWDRFPLDVAAAVRGGDRSWWQVPGRAWFAVATAAAVLAVAVWLPHTPPTSAVVESPDVVATSDLSGDVDVDDTVHWQFVSSVLEGLEQADRHDVIGPVRGTGALETLTPAERDAFAKLLEAELGHGSIE